MNSAFYLLGGIGSVKFAGDISGSPSISARATACCRPTGWRYIIGVQDRVFHSDLLGETKLTNNIEMLHRRDRLLLTE